MLTVEVPLGEFPDEPGRARVGIVVLTHLYEYRLPREVDLKTKDVGGPSGGLMFALGVYNAVTEVDVTGGRKVAGTGSITPDGKVGAVGGVRYKVRAARRRPALRSSSSRRTTWPRPSRPRGRSASSRCRPSARP